MYPINRTSMLLDNIPVSEIMTKKVITIDMHQSLEEAEKMFKEHRIRHLPVIAYGKLQGILSLTDISRMKFVIDVESEQHIEDDGTLDILGIEQVMRVQPKTILIGQSVRDVAELLSKEEYYAIPIVNADGELAGIVTTNDLIRFMLEKG